MKLSNWQKSRDRVAKYRQRNPTKSILYSTIYQYRQEFEYSWSEQFEHKHGFLRGEVLKSFDKFLDCGILFNGAAYLECLDCGYHELLAFSCKVSSICPSCAAKRALIFSENLVDNVLEPVEHAHAVFSIPKRLRPYFQYDRKLIKLLHKASWKTVLQWCQDEYPDLKPAMVTSMHTAGDLLNWNPHVHALLALGAFDTDGNFFAFQNTDTNWLTKVFARNLFELLEKEPCIEDEVIENIKSWKHSGFNVWIGEPIKYQDTDTLKFIARYLRKSPINLKKIALTKDNKTIRITKEFEGKDIHRILKPLDFMAELSMHIPKLFEQQVRYYGQYSARTRGTQSTQYDSPIVIEISEYDKPKKPSTKWAVCMAKVFEVDPLVCPKCAGDMQIRNFIFDTNQIAKIAKYSGQTVWNAPPKIIAANVAA